MAKAAMEFGFYISFSGIVTFKNAGLDITLKEVDIDHLVLETDSPYLTPVPFRGKRNESTYLTYLYHNISNRVDNMYIIGSYFTRSAHQILLH